MKPQTIGAGHSNVVDLFSGKPVDELHDHVIRISPELDGLEMLYTNDTAINKLYSLKIVCWALKESGETVGMVPWLNKIVPCTEINDPLNGHWEGYRDPNCNDIFYSVPNHKIIELETAAQYYDIESEDEQLVLQEIPDAIGTHAVLTDNGFRSFVLVEVLSWQLMGNGEVHAMLVDEERVKSTPVLPGDPCLYSAQNHPEFRYFFQHRIANKIKEQDPEALAAISMLIEK
ncbi:MAG: hypothetical protein COA99_16045 [Moraxellaceae bacterium]|nr:MAG: hypothetical protein COA99_16045 [Moraxellaceae bacterium]